MLTFFSCLPADWYSTAGEGEVLYGARGSEGGDQIGPVPESGSVSSIYSQKNVLPVSFFTRVVFAIAITLVLSSTVIHALLLLIGKVHQHQKSRKRMIEDKNGNPSFENDNSQVTVTNGKNTISINIGGNEKKSLQTKSRSSNQSKSGECTKVGRQLLLSFSAIANSEGLFSFNNRHAVLDTLRFSMTVIIFAVQAFGFTG